MKDFNIFIRSEKFYLGKSKYKIGSGNTEPEIQGSTHFHS